MVTVQFILCIWCIQYAPVVVLLRKNPGLGFRISEHIAIEILFLGINNIFLIAIYSDFLWRPHS